MYLIWDHRLDPPLENLEMLKTACEVTGKEISAEIAGRRGGDPDTLIATSDKSRRVLGWNPQYDDVHKLIETAWKWHSSHPGGYEDK